MYNILFEGWFGIPHSYAVVMCFEIIHLYKKYKDQINFYIHEDKYYGSFWTKKPLDDIYPKEYADILKGLKVYNNEKVDLVYRIVFPYNVSNIRKDCKYCVFYTSEFCYLKDVSYFKSDSSNNKIENVIKDIKTKKNLYFTGPSKWSIQGLAKHGIPNDHNVVVSHGVDFGIFYVDSKLRKQTRDKYNIKDNEILLMNIGAMSGNKGIIYILLVFYILVIEFKMNNLKLLLKGIKDLYNSKDMFSSYIIQLVNNNGLKVDKFNELMTNNIIFTTDSMNFDTLRSLYNACDFYVSPYLAEGFGLTPLEAISCGANLIITSTGSTSDYVDDIFDNYYSKLSQNNAAVQSKIFKIKSKIEDDGEKCINNIDVQNLLDILVQGINNYKYNVDESLIKYLQNNFSWDTMVDKKFEYFKKIIN